MLWKPLHLVPAGTKFDFLGKRRFALIASTAINIISLLAVFFIGLNFGIDFKGGIAIQVRAKEGPAHLDNLRSVVGGLGVGEVSLQEFGDPTQALRWSDAAMAYAAELNNANMTAFAHIYGGAGVHELCERRQMGCSASDRIARSNLPQILLAL